MDPGPLAKRFYFDEFTIEPERGVITYTYSTDAGHSFTHELTLDFPPTVNINALRPAVFALGMAELAHFWKAILAPEIVVKAGALTEEQIAFWENLYTKGLGEFFYVNKIDFRRLVHIVSDPSAVAIPPSSQSHSKRALVPFGGGKDSLVTGEMLKKQGKEFTWFELEPLSFGEKLREISGNSNCISIGRDVAKDFAPIVALVKEGAPNGHVPITATYMMSAVLSAEIHNYSDVVLSLERSASEGNVEYLGQNINHQYSKSFEFEKAASEYIRRYMNPNIRLFSLLRPFYELQIAREFTGYPHYFPYFISCNRGLKTGTWCGRCAKCAFMFAALSAFLAPEDVVKIFGRNLFEDAELLSLYEELIGMHTAKPFDCVGTFTENLLALYLSSERYVDHNRALPVILQKLPVAKGEQYLAMLDDIGSGHLIPKDYRL